MFAQQNIRASLQCSSEDALVPWLPSKCPGKTLIRLRGCAGDLILVWGTCSLVENIVPRHICIILTDAVLQAALLTKDIYRRAHRRHMLGPKTIPAAAASDSMSKLPQIPVREYSIKAREEIRLAERLKYTIASANRYRNFIEMAVIKVLIYFRHLSEKSKFANFCHDLMQNSLS